MGMEHLIPNSERSSEEVKRNSRKGGIKSGETRRKKADMRQAAQNILNSTYTDKSGQKLTGTEILVMNIFKTAMDSKNRNAMVATRMLMELSDNDKSRDEQAKTKEEIAFIKAKRKIIEGGDDISLKKLDQILSGLSNNARIEIESKAK